MLPFYASQALHSIIFSLLIFHPKLDTKQCQSFLKYRWKYPALLFYAFFLSLYFLYLFLLYLLYNIKYWLCLPRFVASEPKLLKLLLYSFKVFSQNKLYFYKRMVCVFPFFFFFYKNVFFFPFRYMNVFFNANSRFTILPFILFWIIIEILSHYVFLIRKHIPIFRLREASNSKPRFLLYRVLKINNSSKTVIISG